VTKDTPRLCALILAATLLLSLVAPGAGAQRRSPHPPFTQAATREIAEASKLDDGEGEIRGSLVHREGEALEAGTEVVLYALSADGDAGLRRDYSDAAGRFRFEAVPNDPTNVYLLAVRVAGVPYGARLAFEPGESEREVEIEILSATTQPDGIEAGAARIRVQQGCTHLRVWHSHTLTNDTRRVAYIPPELRDEQEPLLQVEVAAEAENLVAATGAELEVEAGVARFWGPLYPGQQEVEFGYGLRLEGEEIPLEFRTSLGASRLEVEIPSGLGEPRGDELAAQAENAGHRRFLGPRLEADQDFRWWQRVGPRDQQPALTTPVAQLWFDMDDAVLDVREAHQLRVPFPLPESGLPLLCLALPEQARNARFSGDSLRWGLSREPSGTLALHGPLPAGEPVISLQYDLPVQADPLHFERTFASPLDRLEVVVADTGIVPATPRLHPLRPLHSGGRNYLRLEAFAVEAGEVIPFDFARLPGHGRAPGDLAALASGLGALAAVVFLTAPLFAGRSQDEDAPEDSLARSEREAIYRALDGLDEDLETGKLSLEDHEVMQGELRARAVSLLRAEREPSAAPSVATGCPTCGRPPRQGDRFCSQCGRALRTPLPTPKADS